MKISLILADDHPAVLAGMLYELRGVQTLKVVGTAKNSSETIDLLAQHSCDILITDYIMPGGDFGDGMGMLSFLRRRFPALKILVLTAVENTAVALEMMKLGVKSVINKADDFGHLISAIHAVYAGATYLSPSLRVDSEREGHVIENDSRPKRLSRREVEVVRLYVGGASVTEIAKTLNRTKQTVSSQKSSAMRKLGLSRDVELFRFAYESGVGLASEHGVELHTPRPTGQPSLEPHVREASSSDPHSKA